MREVNNTTRSHTAQAQDSAVRLAYVPACVLLANGERRLWARMSEQERDAYVTECRRARAESEGRA